MDLLATIGRNLSYEDLLPHTVEVNIDEGVRIPVLRMENIISLKEELGGEKGIAVLPILRQTLKELRRKG